jgi:hypothetical protein
MPGSDSRSRSADHAGRGSLIALAFAAVAISWGGAWATPDLWHSGAGIGLPVVAGAFVAVAAWKRLRLPIALTLALLVTTADFVGVLALTLARWEG